MILRGEGRATIRRSSQEILEFVLDLERYRQADRKFRRIRSVTREGNRGLARYSARLRGLPTPTDTQEWRLADDYSRLTFRSTPKLWPNLIATFEGWFECESVEDGTRVVHVETMSFRPPVAWIAVPYLRRWWVREIEEEVRRLKALLEQR